MSEINKVFFIINKYSGTGFPPALEKMVSDACRDARAEFGLRYTEGPGHATTLAAQAAADGFETIVAVGGDGTINEVAQALVNTPACMGIIPKGSGNGLARHLGIPVKFTNALRNIFGYQETAIDTFRINGRLSLNVSGIGFDGLIAEYFGNGKQRGLRGYTKIVLNEFRNFKEFTAEIQTDGNALSTKAFVIAIANSSQYGNNARIAPAASVCDQLLDITVLRKFPIYRLDLVYALFAGTIDRAACCRIQPAREATIVLTQPMYYHVDGEPAGSADRFTVELNPSSLRMLTPRARKV